MPIDCHERLWDMQARTAEAKIPKLCRTGYSLGFPEPWRAAEKALASGVSTRSVDELVKAMGIGGISKSQASRCVAGPTSGGRSRTGRSKARTRAVIPGRCRLRPRCR
jgi:hypothetical protein